MPGKDVTSGGKEIVAKWFPQAGRPPMGAIYYRQKEEGKKQKTICSISDVTSGGKQNTQTILTEICTKLCDGSLAKKNANKAKENLLKEKLKIMKRPGKKVEHKDFPTPPNLML